MGKLAIIQKIENWIRRNKVDDPIFNWLSKFYVFVKHDKKWTFLNEFSKIEINEEKFKNNKKPPRDCKISFDANCVPENVFYIVKEGSDILPNTTCPVDNFKNKNDIESGNTTSSAVIINSNNFLLLTLFCILKMV